MEALKGLVPRREIGNRPALDHNTSAPRNSCFTRRLNMGFFNLLQVPGLPASASVLLTGLGTICASRTLFQIASFIWLHFLRPSSLHRYTKTSTGQEPWAIVTGASDGIGKAFAEELAHRDFNVVLHGRNEEKLTRVRGDLERQWPDRKFRILILDVLKDSQNEARMQTAVDSLADLPIKVLVNNVGGNANQPPLAARDQSFADGDAMLDMNARFQMQFTRMLLPQLIAQHSTLVLNIGSGVSEMEIPFLTVYCAAKAAVVSWSRCLQLESDTEGYGIESIAIVVGGVTTERKEQKASLMEPEARVMARSSLNVVGSGRRVVWAYWFHHLFFGFVGTLPTVVTEKIMSELGKELREEEALKLKGP